MKQILAFMLSCTLLFALAACNSPKSRSQAELNNPASGAVARKQEIPSTMPSLKPKIHGATQGLEGLTICPGGKKLLAAEMLRQLSL